MSDPATRFMLQGVQEWGQSEDDRVKATQDLLDAAGFNAKALIGPILGGIWKEPCCEGPDEERATAWLRNLTDTMPRGRFQDEVAHIEKCIAQARAE